MTDRASAETAAETTDYNPPTWLEELSSGLAIRSQFVVSGNVRDLFPVPTQAGLEFVSFETALWRVLAERGYLGLLVHDVVGGLRLHEGCDPRLADVLDDCGIRLGEVASHPDRLAELVTAVTREGRVPIALVIDYASRLFASGDPAMEQLFIGVDKLARGPAPERPGAEFDFPPRNPVLWIVDRPGDLPEWFATRNAAVRDISVGLPDLGDRYAYAARLADSLDTGSAFRSENRQQKIEQFALRCDGMSLTDMRGIGDLARAEGMGLNRIGDALRSYRIGTTRNPWTSRVMRSRVKNAMGVLEKRVKGQTRAVEKTYDILVRSIMGLSGAQTSSRGNRPRGVLFFVGPTGVGKTELAKAVTEVLFGDETLMQRFDMSEFVNEESIGRLIGPPPGAPGHENGGELINTVRARPFSVFLFDEIEKGHPRILDAFLQILDDGRLTDTRGETGFFSEALIIFTSNVGIVGGDRSTNMGQNILPSDAHDVLQEKLSKAVSDYFRYELRRPELMNRMGQNIVAFEFIQIKSARIIFDAVLKRVLTAIFEEHGVVVTLVDEAKAELMDLCIAELGDGGRGIGNKIETHFINPMARLLFQRDQESHIAVQSVRLEGNETVLDLAAPAAAAE